MLFFKPCLILRASCFFRLRSSDSLKRNDLASQLLRLKIKEKLVMLSPKVENDTNNKESITFVGLNENGEIEDNNNNVNN